MIRLNPNAEQTKRTNKDTALANNTGHALNFHLIGFQPNQTKLN